MAFVNERPGNFPSDGWRTVDYEQNAVLKLDGGIPHGGSWFSLTWNEHNIRFATYEGAGYLDRDDKSKGMVKHFEIFQINLSDSLYNQQDLIKKIISEALSEYRELYQHLNIMQVFVDFSQCHYHKVD